MLYSLGQTMTSAYLLVFGTTRHRSRAPPSLVIPSGRSASKSSCGASLGTLNAKLRNEAIRLASYRAAGRPNRLPAWAGPGHAGGVHLKCSVFACVVNLTSSPPWIACNRSWTPPRSSLSSGPSTLARMLPPSSTVSTFFIGPILPHV